jgi:hypothetical protein
MNETTRITLIIVGFLVAGFALGFMLEALVGHSDSGAPPLGALLGLGLGTAVVALTASRGAGGKFVAAPEAQVAARVGRQADRSKPAVPLPNRH